jgi:hypothetical protein
MKRASLYLLKKNIVLYSLSVGDSSWKASKPFYKLSVDYNEELVDAIRYVLLNSKENVVFDKEYSPVKALKGSTRLTFGKLQGADSKLISLSQENNKIIFSPNKIIGANKGFTPLEEKSIYVNAPGSKEEIIEALKKAVLLCE